MASDVRIWTGTAWQSIVGPAGPTVVSADAGNVAKLGADGRISVQPADMDSRFVNVIGDTMTGALFITTPSTFADALGQFQIKADGVSSMTFSTYSNTAGSSSSIRTYRSRGTVAAPLPVLNGDAIGAPVVVRAWNGTSWSSAGGINFTATGDSVSGAAWIPSRYSMNVSDGSRSVQVFLATHLSASHYAMSATNVYTQVASIGPETSYFVSKVGIGQLVPARTLDVGGDAIVRGPLEVTGNITSAGTAHSFANASIPASAVAPRLPVIPTSNYTLQLADAGSTVINTTAGPNLTLTIPDNATVAFPIGTKIEILDAAPLAMTTIQAAAAVTLQWNSNLSAAGPGVSGSAGAAAALPGPFSRALLYKIGADSWVIIS